MKYTITTFRTEYQVCHYEVEAQSARQARERFRTAMVEFLSTKTMDADECIDEVSPVQKSSAKIQP